MSTKLTITFRAKLDDFAGGKGYKIPKLTQAHVSISDGSMLATTVVGSIGTVSDEMTRARLRKYAGLDLGGVVWQDGADVLGFAENDPRWIITPRGNGFMADLAITVPLAR